MNIVFAVFIILHGLVHLIYFGHAARYFELKPGLTWPDGSWVFSPWLSDQSARFVVSLLLVLAGIGFISGGLGILIRQPWWRPTIIITAILSSLIFILSWNRRTQNLDGQGVVGILIDFWLLAMVVLIRWPQVSL